MGSDQRGKDHGRRTTDDPTVITLIQHRLDTLDERVDEHKEILARVADSVAKLVQIESNLQTMVDGMAEFRAALHGTQTTKGLFTRLGESEARLEHHTRILMYVGGSIGAGIAWGVGQIFYQIWSKATGQ